MSTRLLRSVLCALALTSVAMLGDVHVAHALHCGTTLVAPGDPMTRVRANCGEPATMVTRTEVRTTYGTTYGVAPGALIAVTVQIDQWTYDFGPMRLMEEITFENGIIRSMRSVGYGTSRGTNRSMLKRASGEGRKVPPSSPLLEPRRHGAVPRA